MGFSLFRKSTFEYLIAGLGNPTPKYENNRHNAGYKAVDYIAEKQGGGMWKNKFSGTVYETEIANRRCLLLKPLTFMNNSGESVAKAASFYKIKPERVLILYDDVSLDVGRLRIRTKGSDGGHNGIKSIIMHLNSEDFPRVKIGAGKKPHPDYDLAKWVLTDFKPEDKEPLKQAVANTAQAVSLLVGGDAQEAMNRFNGK